MILIYVETLTMLKLFLKQARGCHVSEPWYNRTIICYTYTVL